MEGTDVGTFRIKFATRPRPKLNRRVRLSSCGAYDMPAAPHVSFQVTLAHRAEDHDRNRLMCRCERDTQPRSSASRSVEPKLGFSRRFNAALHKNP